MPSDNELITDKQRRYIAFLCYEHLGWTSEQLAAYADLKCVDLVTMTKAEASKFIDGLKQLTPGRA